MRPRHRGRSRQMMPLERTGAFTLACSANLLVVALAMVFLSQGRRRLLYRQPNEVGWRVLVMGTAPGRLLPLLLPNKATQA